MYQVIARKYRPQTFEDVVNQEHVKQTLRNALQQRRVAHGYIFSGQRGTGKTTVARLLAKALNCEKGPTPEPCLECSSCREIVAGNALDLIEIDAASNRRIDDIRELRENVRYRPVRDRYKVFIIDEAHQITSDAFNALLKTLEEPPEWVVFILCTTEPQEFPATIVSRCQSFQFRTVEVDQIVGRMQWICQQEGIEADTDALVSIALAGDGSIRDALSTLDQAIACFGKSLSAKSVRDLLGAIPSEITEQITTALQERNAPAVLDIVDRLFREGHHLQHFCGELTRYFRNLLVMKVAGADTRLVTAGSEERKRLSLWLERFSQEDLTRYLQLLLVLYRELQHAPQPRFRLEIGLLKLVYAGHLQPIEKVLAEWSGGEKAAPDLPNPTPAAKGGAAQAEPRPLATKPGAPGRSVTSSRSTPEPAGAAWSPPTAERKSIAGSSGPKVAVRTDIPAPAAGNAELKKRLVARLRAEQHDSVADAVEHGLVVESGNFVQIHSLSDYQTSLKLSLGTVEETLKQILDRDVRVKLGLALDEMGAAQNLSVGSPDFAGAAVSTEKGVGPAAPGEGPVGASDVVARALADPEVQKFRELFGGQVREVRDLRELPQRANKEQETSP